MSERSTQPKKQPSTGRPDILGRIRLASVPDCDCRLLAELIAKIEADLDSKQRQMAGILRELRALKGEDIEQSLALTGAGSTFAKAVASVNGTSSSVHEDLIALQRGIAEWSSAERRTRKGRFSKAAAQLGWTLVGTWPEPVVEQIVFVVVDEEKDTATVNGIPLSGNPTAERLLVACHDELAALVRDRAKPQAFISELWKAYQATGAKPGQAVGVFNLLRSLLWLKQTKRFQLDGRAEGFRPYPTAQFRADLTHYLGSGAPPVREKEGCYRLELAAGSFAQDGIFMYFPETERLSSCGRVTFQTA